MITRCGLVIASDLLRTLLPPPQQVYNPASTSQTSIEMCKWARPGSASHNRVFYGTLLFLFIIPVCYAVLVNRTIDSDLGDPLTGFVPIYQPKSPWDDQTCSDSYCMIQPDRAKAFDGTWTAATYSPKLQNVNITLRFTGVAVWVFFILSNANIHGTSITTNTRVNITLDGQHAGNFSHDPNMNTFDLIYNATIFSTSGLANISHELVISTNDYPIRTFINFDWAIYTVDEGAPASQSISSSTTTFPLTTDSSMTSTSPPIPASLPQSPSSKTGVIVGCTLGGLVVVTLFILFLVHQLRRAPPVVCKEAEGILDIDVPPHRLPYGKVQNYRRDPSPPSPSEYTYFPPSSSSTQIPVLDHVLEQRNAARVPEARQTAADDYIQSAQRELGCLESARNASEIISLSATGPPHTMPELASLRNEVQRLRDQIGYLHTQRESDMAFIQ